MTMMLMMMTMTRTMMTRTTTMMMPGRANIRASENMFRNFLGTIANSQMSFTHRLMALLLGVAQPKSSL